MPRNVVSIDEFGCDRASLLLFYDSIGDSSEHKAKMKKILSKAITCELTERQRYCLVEFYIHQKKKQDIAKDLSINPATVTRHIQRAVRNLRHIADYY